MLQFDAELYALRPWYHDFSSLGFDTTFLQVPLTFNERVQRAKQLASSRLQRLWRLSPTSPVPKEPVRSIREIFRRLPSSHLLNQPVKEEHLMSLVERALVDLNSHPSCLELFCADGYYSCRIKTHSPGASVTGLELDENHIRRAETMSRRLGLEGISFRREDVRTFLDQSPEPYDLVLCAGGLYHISDPVRLLQQLKNISRGYVVIQSVVTLKTEDPGYFTRPAPGWQHGCRFTHAWLRERLSEEGWKLLMESRTELPGNRRLRDRGSSFFLCRAS